MSFVIKNKEGKYLKIPRSRYSKTKIVDNILDARIYDRKCDAANSLSYLAMTTFVGHSASLKSDYEIVDLSATSKKKEKQRAVITTEDGMHIPLEADLIFHDTCENGYISVSGLDYDTAGKRETQFVYTRIVGFKRR